MRNAGARVGSNGDLDAEGGDISLVSGRTLATWEIGRIRVRTGAVLAVVVAGGMLLAGCNPFQARTVHRADINNKTKFSQAEYGVKASPRVTEEVEVTKGGGRYLVGKPYRVRGKWYKPRENPVYAATGIASWYGPNFHGRLTANGEVYDQYSLSAAHPTLPLPCYARVTNLENGRSVMVRVNDRGPFARGRIIDLSAGAAKLLDYTAAGVARVKVEYAGMARIDGHDEAFLLASYRGPDAPGIAPGGSQPGTLIALNEGQNAVGSQAAAAAEIGSAGFTPPGTEAIYSGSVPPIGELAFVPIPTQRPTNFDGIAIEVADGFDVAGSKQTLPAAFKPLGFAAEAQSRIATAFSAVGGDAPAAAYALPELDAASRSAEQAGQTVVVSLGTFADPTHAEFIRGANADLGLISVRRSWSEHGNAWDVRLLAAADIAPELIDLLKGRGLRARIVAK